MPTIKTAFYSPSSGAFVCAFGVASCAALCRVWFFSPVLITQRTAHRNKGIIRQRLKNTQSTGGLCSAYDSNPPRSCARVLQCRACPNPAHSTHCRPSSQRVVIHRRGPIFNVRVRVRVLVCLFYMYVPSSNSRRHIQHREASNRSGLIYSDPNFPGGAVVLRARDRMVYTRADTLDIMITFCMCPIKWRSSTDIHTEQSKGIPVEWLPT